MFFSLFIKECRQVLKSLIFYLYLVILGMFYLTQLSEFPNLDKPVQGQESYGTKESQDESVIMRDTAKNLKRDWENNQYTTYPFGFYKSVSLNEEKQEKVKQILDTVNAGELPYTKFEEYMEQVDQLLGGNGSSNYAPGKLASNTSEEITYEEAMKEYEDVLKLDRVSGAHARLFCDYLVIIMGIMPVFLAVTRGLRDKRAGMNSLIYSRKVSSWTVVLSRYLATIVMTLLPVLILSVSPSLESAYMAQNAGVNPDFLAYVKTILVWLLPTMLVSISVGFFITELTEGPLAILIQGVWWYISLNMQLGRGLTGEFAWNLMPRWNTDQQAAEFAVQKVSLYQNRLFYLILAFALAAATVLIYHLKRKGKFRSNGKLSADRKSKSKI